MDKIARRITGWACLALMLASCGGEEFGADTPPGKCRALLGLICDRGSECFNDSTPQSQCITTLETQRGFSCSQAVGVGASYDTCLSDLRTSTCAQLTSGTMFYPPASCSGVIMN